jgi:hypothetical protein
MPAACRVPQGVVSGSFEMDIGIRLPLNVQRSNVQRELQRLRDMAKKVG